MGGLWVEKQKKQRLRGRQADRESLMAKRPKPQLCLQYHAPYHAWAAVSGRTKGGLGAERVVQKSGSAIHRQMSCQGLLLDPL
jgi:hypothetical protein